jgi:hypothetical protein
MPSRTPWQIAAQARALQRAARQQAHAENAPAEADGAKGTDFRVLTDAEGCVRVGMRRRIKLEHSNRSAWQRAFLVPNLSNFQLS